MIPESSSSHITVEWSDVSDKEIQTSGYKLYIDDGNDGDFKLAMDGTNKPGVRKYTVSGLKENIIYRFKVGAVNFNGAGPNSTETLIQACNSP